MNKADRVVEIARLERAIAERRVILSRAGEVLTPTERQARADIAVLVKKLRKLKAQAGLF